MLAVNGHGNCGVAHESIFAFPKDSGGLQVEQRLGLSVSLSSEPHRQNPHPILSIEADSTPSVERHVSKHTGLFSTPGHLYALDETTKEPLSMHRWPATLMLILLKRREALIISRSAISCYTCEPSGSIADSVVTSGV